MTTARMKREGAAQAKAWLTNPAYKGLAYKWVGNSAQRLCYVLAGLATSGSDTQHRFITGYRVHINV